MTVVKEIASPRLPTLKGKIRSRELQIPVFSSENMELEQSAIGLRGSPTKVVKIDTPKVTRGGRVVRAADDEDVVTAVDELMKFLEARGIAIGRDRA